KNNVRKCEIHEIRIIKRGAKMPTNQSKGVNPTGAKGKVVATTKGSGGVTASLKVRGGSGSTTGLSTGDGKKK
ncbi:MAG: hypothetical protein AABX82_03450, partial [Nanoarchaeota archaeon]